MLPLAVLNGRPILGCVCADGQYKTNCPLMKQAAESHTNELSIGDSCCGANCCAEPVAAEPSRSCCEKTVSNGEGADASDRAARVRDGSGCCHVVVESPAPPLLVDAVHLNDAHDLPALSLLGFESFGTVDAAAFEQRIDDDTGPSPPDLVITLRRLIL